MTLLLDAKMFLILTMKDEDVLLKPIYASGSG